MTKPNRKQVAAMLVPWLARHKALGAAFEPLEAYFSVENPIWDAAWLTFDDYTDALAKLVGDEFDWLQWWQTECGMGAKEGEASPRKGVPVRKIRNLSGLAWLIVESRE